MDNILTRKRLSREFLEKLHLYRGNPFRNKQAEIEGDLQEYFVPTIHFYRMMDLNEDLPRSAVLSAAPGAGKTANRCILEACLRDGRFPTSLGYESLPSTLVVPYVHFDWLLKNADNQIAHIDLESHVNALLREMISCLTEEVVRQNHTFAAFLKPKYGYLLRSYSDLCHEVALENYVYKIRSTLKFALEEAENIIRSACQQAPKAEYLDSYGHLDLLKEFLDLITPLGFQKTVVLIDRVDELSLTAGHPELVADFVEPLLKELQLLEIPNLVFKFFLPDDAVEILFRRPGVRIGEKISYYRVQWETSELIALVRERLIKLSGSGLKDLGQFADSETKDVTRILAREAKGSPRNLFRLCELLLLHLEDQTKGNERPVITLDLVKRAIDSFLLEVHKGSTTVDDISSSQNFANELTIDNELPGIRINDDFSIQYRGNKAPVNLSPHELSLLRRFLDEPNKVISHDELLKKIYPHDWNDRSESDLTSIIKRLRQKLAKLPNRPDFIKTKRGHGYLLDPDPEPQGQ